MSITPESTNTNRHAPFPPTMWSALLDVQGDSSGAMRGMERLATAYWRPLYVFLRKRGQDHEAADGV